MRLINTPRRHQIYDIADEVATAGWPLFDIDVFRADLFIENETLQISGEFQKSVLWVRTLNFAHDIVTTLRGIL